MLYTDGITEAEKRPSNIFHSATVHLNTTEAFEQFKDAITADRRLNLDVTREIDYHSAQSGRTSHLIAILGGHVASVMAIGAIFGALNTMYSAVAERGREIATMRALGFDGGSDIFSFLIEALLISLLGGIVGCLAVLPLNGLTTGAMNWQTFTHLAFAFQYYAFAAHGWGHLCADHGFARRPASRDPRGVAAGCLRPARTMSL